MRALSWDRIGNKVEQAAPVLQERLSRVLFSVLLSVLQVPAGTPCKREDVHSPLKALSPFLVVKWHQGPPSVHDGELDFMVMRAEAARQ